LDRLRILNIGRIETTMAFVAPKTIVLSSGELLDTASIGIGPEDTSGISVHRLEEILDSAGPRKRKRLTHLSPEERMLRR
jgi:hypothetical protein